MDSTSLLANSFKIYKQVFTLQNSIFHLFLELNSHSPISLQITVAARGKNSIRLCKNTLITVSQAWRSCRRLVTLRDCWQRNNLIQSSHIRGRWNEAVAVRFCPDSVQGFLRWTQGICAMCQSQLQTRPLAAASDGVRALNPCNGQKKAVSEWDSYASRVNFSLSK